MTITSPLMRAGSISVENRNPTRLVIAFLATLALLLASGVAADSANAGRYYYCGVQKSGQSWCPQLEQAGIERHSYQYVYTWDSDLGSSRCAGHRMAAYIGYPAGSGDAKSPKYDRNSNTCNEGYYDIHLNNELLRVYGMHFHNYQVKFSGWGDY